MKAKITSTDLLENGELIFGPEDAENQNNSKTSLEVFRLEDQIRILDLKASGRDKQVRIMNQSATKILFDTSKVRIFIKDGWYQLPKNDSFMQKINKIQIPMFEVGSLN